jgi:hypothetical protein
VHVAGVIRPGGDQHGVLARYSLLIATLPVRDIRRPGILSDNLPVQGPDLPLSQQLSHGSSGPVTTTRNGSPVTDAVLSIEAG